MKTCTICGKNLEHVHHNRKQCEQHQHSIKPEQHVTIVSVPLEELNMYKDGYEELQRYKRYVEFLERTEQ